MSSPILQYSNTPIFLHLMLELSIYIITFILLSGLLAMIDAAVLSVSHAEIEEMVLQRKYGAWQLKRIHKKVTHAVVIIVIITNTINVLGPILVGQKAVEIFGSTVIGIITAILAFGTIIFSEIIPKSLGAHYAPQISRTFAPAILTLIYLLYPIVVALDHLASYFRKGSRHIGTEDQIRSLVTIGRRAGHIESDEGQLIHRAFILNDKRARDAMTDLKDIISLNDSAIIRDAADKVFQHTHSRYPVFGTSIHDVLGFVMSHDVLESVSKGDDKELVTSVLREGLIVDADMKCDDLMVLFRDRNVHLAIVQEEGKTVGLVTLEDVLEQLVGDIEDEMDVED